MLVEACAGLLDTDDAATAAIREAEEETGHRVPGVQHVVTCYLSPGGLTQKIHCFIAKYSAETRVSAGGGLEAEGEDIEVLELPFPKALAMIGKEIIDAQTIVLLQHLALSGLMKR
jgi:nudix-type nucleoside diphosphatase (YffH/AdpP family)